MAAAAGSELALGRILLEAASARRRAITAELYRLARGRCLGGPFVGMELLDEASWGDGDIAPKLLGCYEAELHGAIERAIARRPGLVVNVGCAEGYYAVGLARRLPAARIEAFDTDPKARLLCEHAAARNGIAERLVVNGHCSRETLAARLRTASRALVLLDCEGGERTLLDPQSIGAFRHCDLIIECHDFLDPTITQQLCDLLADTHHLEKIREGPRDPAGFPMLQRLGSLDRWLLVCEFRPQVMAWLVAWSKEPGGGGD